MPTDARARWEIHADPLALLACAALCLALPTTGLGQNLDLAPTNALGPYRALAGTGTAAAEGIFALPLNPAGLEASTGTELALSLAAAHHSYSRTNTRHADGLKAIFEHGKNEFDLGSALASLPIRNLTLALGVVQRLNPFIDNQRRAFTWSNLFNHRTEGGLHAITLGSAAPLGERVALGASLYWNLGTVTSEVRGDNHGNDADKHARLESELRGVNAKLGALLRLSPSWRAGIAVELPYDLGVSVTKEVSEDSLYAPLLPDYDRASWRMPWTFAIGLAFIGARWSASADYETHQYTNSEIQLNLFEFGGVPNWSDVHTFRAGFEMRPTAAGAPPLRLGYAYVPQLYASGDATGASNTVLSWEDTDQNIKHVVSGGTAFTVARLTINLALEYSSLSWRRQLEIPAGSIEDDATETSYRLTLDLLARL